jgi:hypothetical protein
VAFPNVTLIKTSIGVISFVLELSLILNDRSHSFLSLWFLGYCLLCYMCAPLFTNLLLASHLLTPKRVFSVGTLVEIRKEMRRESPGYFLPLYPFAVSLCGLSLWLDPTYMRQHCFLSSGCNLFCALPLGEVKSSFILSC